MEAMEPLEIAEVAKLTNNAWQYELRGDNLKGRGGSVVVSNEMVRELLYGTDRVQQDALQLWLFLRAHHYGREFNLAAAACKALCWDARRFKAARKVLVARGYLLCLHPGGKGKNDPPVYKLARGTKLHPN
jgi:hypothetical protein